MLLRDPLGQGDQFLPCPGNLVSVLREGARRVPDERFHARPHGNRIDSVLNGSVLFPDVPVIGVEVCQGLSLNFFDPAGKTGDETSQQAGLWEISDVRWGVGVDLDGELGLELTGPFVVDLDSGAFFEWLEGLDVGLVLGGDDRGIDID